MSEQEWNERLRGAIRSGLAFLDDSQREDGYFPYFRWPADKPEGPTSMDETPFATACVAYCLTHLGDASEDILGKAKSYLMSLMSAAGLWRYWTGGRVDLPPDLDDTSLCSFLLRENHPHILFGTNIPAILGCRNDEGVFETWVGLHWDDICPVVNANVLLYLGDRPETAGASSYLVEVMAGLRQSRSLYYPDEITHLYAVSRALKHGAESLAPAREHIIRRTLTIQLEDGSFGNALHTALACCALLNTGQGDTDAVDGAVRWLVSHQTDKGSWPLVRYYQDSNHGARLEFGSQALTTAFCLEALAQKAQRV